MGHGQHENDGWSCRRPFMRPSLAPSLRGCLLIILQDPIEEAFPLRSLDFNCFCLCSINLSTFLQEAFVEAGAGCEREPSCLMWGFGSALGLRPGQRIHLSMFCLATKREACGLTIHSQWHKRWKCGIDSLMLSLGQGHGSRLAETLNSGQALPWSSHWVDSWALMEVSATLSKCLP